MCCRVANCCFISNLRLAATIIAVLSLLGNVGVVAFTSWNIKEIRLTMLQELKKGQSDSLLATGLRVALAWLAVTLIVSIVAVFLDGVLFIGVIRRRRDMVQTWSHGHAVVSGAYMLHFWMLLVGIFANGYILIGFLFLIACIIGTLLTVYFWVVVRSFDFRLHQMQLRTVTANCGPSDNNHDKPPPYSSYA